MARSRAKDYDDKRLIILHRSAQLFAEAGYVGTSMNTIADACRVSKALLYHYYPDKEAILFDILSAHLEKLVAAVERADDETANPQAVPMEPSTPTAPMYVPWFLEPTQSSATPRDTRCSPTVVRLFCTLSKQQAVLVTPATGQIRTKLSTAVNT